MRRSVRRLASAALLIAWLQRPVAAQPPNPDPHYDPAAAPTPWLDQGASPVPRTTDPAIEPTIESRIGSPAGSPTESPAEDHKLAAALTLGGLYAGFTTWTYFAWYRKH